MHVVCRSTICVAVLHYTASLSLLVTFCVCAGVMRCASYALRMAFHVYFFCVSCFALFSLFCFVLELQFLWVFFLSHVSLLTTLSGLRFLVKAHL